MDIVYRLDIVYMQCDCHCYFLLKAIDLTWLDFISLVGSELPVFDPIPYLRSWLAKGHSIVREYVSTFFSKSKNATFYVFFEVSYQKNKNVESIVQVFTFLHWEIAERHFHCKTITHIML